MMLKRASRVRDLKILRLRELEKENRKLKSEIGKLAETIVYLENKVDGYKAEIMRLKT